jgi:hypothetical protein
MELIKRNKNPVIWFLCGFGFGLMWLGLSHAAIPSKGTSQTTIREIKGGKISSPEFEVELSELNRLEKKYLESDQQIERLKNRNQRKTARLALPGHRNPSVKKGVRK